MRGDKHYEGETLEVVEKRAGRREIMGDGFKWGGGILRNLVV